MQTESYVVLRPFMVEELGLKGSELVAYALIYGFSKFVADNQRRFYETLMQRSVESGISEIFLQNM